MDLNRRGNSTPHIYTFVLNRDTAPHRPSPLKAKAAQSNGSLHASIRHARSLKGVASGPKEVGSALAPPHLGSVLNKCIDRPVGEYAQGVSQNRSLFRSIGSLITSRSGSSGSGGCSAGKTGGVGAVEAARHFGQASPTPA